MTVAPEVEEVTGVSAEVNYVRNPPPTGANVLEFVPDAEEHSTLCTLPGHPMWIANARSLTPDLDREGFVLLSHVSAVQDFDALQVDPEVDQLYIDEMSHLLAQLTNASKVVMSPGPKKRYGESATDKLAMLSNAKPARYPHADNTDASSETLAGFFAQALGGVDLESYSRYALYNMWRPITSPPQDFPLAVCDARSVAPEDEVTITAVTEEQGGIHIRHDTTGYLYNSEHRWHYYRDMCSSEVLVFKAHDTDQRRACRVPHTAFTDPSCPPNTPTRASVEVRGLVLFE
jgi:hypothetical protein